MKKRQLIIQDKMIKNVMKDVEDENIIADEDLNTMEDQHWRKWGGGLRHVFLPPKAYFAAPLSPPLPRLH